MGEESICLHGSTTKEQAYLRSAAKSADHQDRVSQASGGYVQLGQSCHAEQRLPACRLQQCNTDAEQHKHKSLLPSPPFSKDAHGDGDPSRS